MFSTSNTRNSNPSSMWLVPIICGLAVLFEGYDIIVYGSVVPALLEYEQWSMTPEQAGLIGSYALVGMMFGAIVAGSITDVIGRRKMLLGCITWFSLLTALCGLAPNPEIFGILRFLAGLGLGGLIPVAAALTLEFAPARRRNLYYLAMMASYNVGGLLAAGLAIPLLPALGWRAMFLLALAPFIIVVPLILKYMPESVSFLVAKGRTREAEDIAQRYGVVIESTLSQEEGKQEEAGQQGKLQALRALVSRNYVISTLGFWVAAFMGLLLIYGLSTWLPEIMTVAGYSVGSALSFLLLFNVGAIVGQLAAGVVADRVGAKAVCATSFMVAAVSIALLSIPMPLVLTYVVAGLAGVGTFSGMTLVYSYAGQYYPTNTTVPVTRNSRYPVSASARGVR